MAELVCHCLACFAQCLSGSNIHIPANSCDCCCKCGGKTCKCCGPCPELNCDIFKEWIVWSLLLSSGLLLVGLIGAGLYASSDDRNYVSTKCLVLNYDISTGCLSCYFYWDVSYGNMTSQIQSGGRYDQSQALNHVRAHEKGKVYSCYDPEEPSHVVWSIKANTWRVVMIVFLVLWGALCLSLITGFIIWKFYCLRGRNRTDIELNR